MDQSLMRHSIRPIFQLSVTPCAATHTTTGRRKSLFGSVWLVLSSELALFACSSPVFQPLLPLLRHYEGPRKESPLACFPRCSSTHTSVTILILGTVKYAWQVKSEVRRITELLTLLPPEVDVDRLLERALGGKLAVPVAKKAKVRNSLDLDSATGAPKDALPEWLAGVQSSGNSSLPLLNSSVRTKGGAARGCYHKILVGADALVEPVPDMSTGLGTEAQLHGHRGIYLSV